MTQSTHRIYTFDLLRGLAVVTMILAHSVYFFHVRDNPTLIGLENFGNTVSFITFLVVSGAVTWVAMFSGGRAGRPVNGRRVAGRVGMLLLAYYLLALIVTIPDFITAVGWERLRLIGNILSFRFLPGFMEYFPPFIFYAAAIGFWPRLFWTISQRFRYVLVASALTFFGGDLLARLDIGSLWQPWLSLLAGGEGIYRFPLLQYSSVFFLGLFWGHQAVVHDGLAVKRELVSRLGWLALYGAVVAYIITTFTDIPLATMFSRWPPSIPFLALGLAFAFLAANLLYRFHQLRRLPLLRDGLLVFGQNALGLFWSHIFLLKMYEIAGGGQVSSPLIVLGLFLLVVIVSVALTTFLPFNYRLALTAIRGSHEDHEEALERESVFRLSKELAAETAETTTDVGSYFMPNPRTHSKSFLRRRHQFGLTLLAVVAAALIFPIASEELALQRQQRGADVWWDTAVPYRQPLTVQYAASFVNLPVGTTVAIQLNHQTLVEQRKSRADGRDLELVYWDGEEHLIIDPLVISPNQSNTIIKFRTPTPLEGNKPEQFFSLYYGRFFDHVRAPAQLDSATALTARFGVEESRPLIGQVATVWNLIGQPNTNFVTFSLTSTDEHDAATATYSLIDTELTGVMVQTSPTSWTAEVPVDNLTPGVYRLQATLRDADNREFLSTISGFYRSHPLYVAWTQDWEGYDVNQNYLTAIESIANDYQLPITHFFNPSIFISETIKPQRAKSLTQWLQRRITLGDGFGLHLHLFHEFVEKAGVEVREQPNWGDRGDGYGVPLSAYTADEQTILIKYAVDLLFDNGLPQSKMFRAGGWYANLDTFKALERLGFTVDSSARTKYSFGRNRLPGHWDVSTTAQPYFPSRSNQNVTGETTFPILEIPNNGADSYAFSAAAMIERFTLLFTGDALSEPKQLTYLSHPHWFDDQEQARVREILAHANRYRYSDDTGPVIFTTTENIAKLWGADD